MVPRENKNNAYQYAKFEGTNKEYYGIFQTGLFIIYTTKIIIIITISIIIIIMQLVTPKNYFDASFEKLKGFKILQ